MERFIKNDIKALKRYGRSAKVIYKNYFHKKITFEEFMKIWEEV